MICCWESVHPLLSKHYKNLPETTGFQVSISGGCRSRSGGFIIVEGFPERVSSVPESSFQGPNGLFSSPLQSPSKSFGIFYSPFHSPKISSSPFHSPKISSSPLQSPDGAQIITNGHIQRVTSFWDYVLKSPRDIWLQHRVASSVLLQSGVAKR